MMECTAICDPVVSCVPAGVLVRYFSIDPSKPIPADVVDRLCGPARTILDASSAPVDRAKDDNDARNSMFGVNLDLVVNDFHIQAAIHRSYCSASNHKMKTRSFPGEILYQLATTGKINEAVRQFSVHQNCSALAVVFLPPSNSGESLRDAYSILCENVGGTEISPSDVQSLLSDEKRAAIAKLFKLSPIEASLANFESAVITKLAMKDLE